MARFASTCRAFFDLPFQAAAGSEPLLQAIEILRALDAGARAPLTPDDPCGFVPADWRAYLVADGKLDRRIWEMALAFAVRDALRAGSLFLAESREHVSFWNLIYDSRNWQESRPQAYQQLGLPTDPHELPRQDRGQFRRRRRGLRPTVCRVTGLRASTRAGSS